MSDSLIRRHLDSDIRPNAPVVTASSSVVGETEDEIYCSGVLGAIHSESPGRFVGFTGVEIFVAAFAPLESKQIEFQFLSFESDLREPLLTVQLVDLANDSYSVVLAPSLQPFCLPLSDFCRSYRGRILPESYAGTELKSVRFFLKRSDNAPKTNEKINFSFYIHKASLKLAWKT